MPKKRRRNNRRIERPKPDFLMAFGLPGAGKTHLGKMLASHGWKHVKGDDYIMRAIETNRGIANETPLVMAKLAARAAAREVPRRRVILEGLLVNPRIRQAALTVINTRRGKVKRLLGVWVNTPPEQCIINLLGKGDLGAAALVQAHSKDFQPPTLSEGFDELIQITPQDDTLEVLRGHGIQI